MLKYTRILLKITGEIFAEVDKQGIGYDPVKRVAQYIAYLINKYPSLRFTIVLGAGNLFRGRNWKDVDFDPATADYMGMAATIINGLALRGVLDKLGIETRLLTAVKADKLCEENLTFKGRAHLEKGRVVILVGGLGRPFTTTDSAAAQYAIEFDCEVLLKGSNVDGVYDSDPKTNPNAIKYETLSYQEALIQGLTVMDATAFAMCKTHSVKIIVFDIDDLNNIERIICGEEVGTLVS